MNPRLRAARCARFAPAAPRRQRSSARSRRARPSCADLAEWINTPGGRPLTLKQLRGKVVLVDFWTYSCINCIRTFPHLKAWDRAYRKDGLVIIGIHTPEFSFERVPSNVREAAKRFGLRYPVALDNGYKTWQRVPQRVLAGRVPHRQARRHPAHTLRRGLLRRDGVVHPPPARRAGVIAEDEGRRSDSVGDHDARDVPRLRPPRPLHERDRRRPLHDVPLPGGAAPSGRSRLRRPLAGRSPAGDGGRRCAARPSLSGAPRAHRPRGRGQRGRARGRPQRCGRSTSPGCRASTRRSRSRAPAGGLLELRPTPGVAAFAFTFS